MGWIKKIPDNTERFYISAISQAIGKSEGSISGYCSRIGIPTKGGLTIDQIIAVIDAPEGTKSMNWKKVRRIKDLLRERGYSWEEEARQINEGEVS